MNEQEYKNKIDAIDRESKARKTVINREFALANISIKTGDIISDHMGNIVVESIGFYFDTNKGLPACVFFGSIINKNGTLSKKGVNKRSVFQSNLKL